MYGFPYVLAGFRVIGVIHVNVSKWWVFIMFYKVFLTFRSLGCPYGKSIIYSMDYLFFPFIINSRPSVHGTWKKCFSYLFYSFLLPFIMNSRPSVHGTWKNDFPFKVNYFFQNHLFLLSTSRTGRYMKKGIPFKIISSFQKKSFLLSTAFQNLVYKKRIRILLWYAL